jgi:hypothetical protein
VLTAILAVEERLKQHRIFVLAVHDLGPTFCDVPGGLVCSKEARIWKALTGLLAHFSVSCEVVGGDNWGAYRSKEVIGGWARLCLFVAALSFWKEIFVVSLVRLGRRNPTE